MRLGFTLRSFIKYLITFSLLFTFLINLKFRQNSQLNKKNGSNSLLILQTNLNDNKSIEVDNLRYLVHEANNEEPLEGSYNNFSLVILVQVHKRVKYLEMLIKSLNSIKRQNDEFFVVFSHDFYSVEMNELIRNESQFFYKQIFYPFMLQLNENMHPGLDPNDCPKSIKKHDALRMRCVNAANPDTYGHYREFKIVQIKHHWFWKLSFVFDSYAFTKYNKNFGILLLEEDYYLLPDTLFVLEKLKQR